MKMPAPAQFLGNSKKVPQGKLTAASADRIRMMAKKLVKAK